MRRGIDLCLVVAVVAVVLLPLPPIIAAERQTVSVTCRFDIPQLVPETNGYDRVTVAGCLYGVDPGRPMLPFRTLRVLLPSGSTIIGVSAWPQAGTVMIRAPRPVTYGSHPIPVGDARFRIAYPDTAPDAAIYQSTNAYPGQSVELISMQRMKGHDIAIVRVFPARYAPGLRRVLFTPSLRIDIGVIPALQNAAMPRGNRTSDREQIATLVDNPDMLSTYDAGTSLAAHVLTPAGGSSAYDYLLVTGAALLPSFDPLIRLREGQGIVVKTETMETITNSYAGVDSAEKLRNYIRYAYTNWGVKYVLLGGDISIVPKRGVYAYSSGETETSMPSDLYFACLDGSWNGNSNSVWGEPTDGDRGGDVDLLAEVLVGRAPVETPEEVVCFVAKTLAAESNDVERCRICLAGEYLGYGRDFDQGGDALAPLLAAVSNSHSVVTWLDDRPSHGAVWTAADAIRELNGAPLLVAHQGHTDEGTIMRIDSSGVASLSNAWPFLIYSAGCDAGAFDNFMSPDCIGEELVKNNTHGAFAALVNSRLGWYDSTREWLYSGEYQKRFFDGILTGGRSCLGVAHQKAKEDMVGSVETSGDMPYRWCYFGIILLGDPCSAIHVPIKLSFKPPATTSSCVIEWNSQSNATYSVLRTTDLVGSKAVCVASNIPALSPLNTYTDAVQSVEHVFYRIRETR
jgi:Peptidase family C25